MPHYDIKQELPILKGGDDSTRLIYFGVKILQVILIRLVKVLVSVSFSLGLNIETLKISVSVSVSKLRLWKI